MPRAMSAKNDYNQAKNDAAGSFDSGQRKAAKEHADKTKPIDDSAGMADGYRERLAVLAADYRKFKLNPEAPAPTRESYDRYSDPERRAVHAAGPHGAAAQAAREPDHPQGDEGRPRSLGLRLRDPAAGWSRLGGRIGRDGHCIGAAAVVGGVLAFVLRTWLVKLSQVSAREPLRAAHALAGRRRCA